MMAQETYRAALATYQAAVEGYFTPVATRGPAAAPVDPGARAEAVEAASRAFGEAAAGELAAGDPGRRELARFQLLAGAVADLAVAQQLAAAGGVTLEAGTRGAAAGVPAEARPDVAAILSLRPEDGVRGLAAPPATRAARPTDPAAARAALKEAVAPTLKGLSDSAAAAAQVSLLGLTGMPAGAVQQAASGLVHEALLKMGEGVSAVLRKAVSLVLRAVEKVLAALGPNARREVGQRVEGWIKDLQQGPLAQTVLARLYELPRIEQEVLAQVDGADPGLAADRFNGAADALAALAARAGKQKDLIAWIVRGLAWAQTVLLGLTPWGPLALATGYVSLVGYSVWSGGDYVDWYRTGDGGVLDRVAGVRAVVREALTPAAG